MGEFSLLHLCNNDEIFMKKLINLLAKNGYQVNLLHNSKKVSGLLKFSGLEILPDRHQVFLNGKEDVLTSKEFQILMLLAENRGRVFSKEQIYNMVWNNEYVYDGRNMTAYINKIRRKIEPNPARPRYILTVWGVGYKFNGEIEPADNVE